MATGSLFFCALKTKKFFCKRNWKVLVEKYYQLIMGVMPYSSGIRESPCSPLRKFQNIEGDRILSIQRCKYCSKQFSWKSIFLSLAFGYKPIVCSNCSSEHHPTAFTRLLIGFSVPAPLLAGHFNVNFYRTYYFLLLYLFWFALILCLVHFFARYDVDKF